MAKRIIEVTFGVDDDSPPFDLAASIAGRALAVFLPTDDVIVQISDEHGTFLGDATLDVPYWTERLEYNSLSCFVTGTFGNQTCHGHIATTVNGEWWAALPSASTWYGHERTFATDKVAARWVEHQYAKSAARA